MSAAPPHNPSAVIGPFLLLAALLLPLFRARRRHWIVRAALLAACLAVVLSPLNGLTVTAYFRGLVWQLSLTTMMLLACVILRQAAGIRLLQESDRASILSLAAVAGLVLYPTVTGLMDIDLYRLGYQPLTLVFILLALAIAAWASKRRAAAIFTLILVAAFDLHLLDSANLWDYLIDPIVTLFAWGWVIYRLALLLRKSRQEGCPRQRRTGTSPGENRSER